MARFKYHIGRSLSFGIYLRIRVGSHIRRKLRLDIYSFVWMDLDLHIWWKLTKSHTHQGAYCFYVHVPFMPENRLGSEFLSILINWLMACCHQVISLSKIKTRTWVNFTKFHIKIPIMVPLKCKGMRPWQTHKSNSYGNCFQRNFA